MGLTVTANSVQASGRSSQQTPTFFLFLGIFLTSAATLTLQISIIRLLSVAQWYHFAFMVVSMVSSVLFLLAGLLYALSLLAVWKSS